MILIHNGVTDGFITKVLSYGFVHRLYSRKIAKLVDLHQADAMATIMERLRGGG